MCAVPQPDSPYAVAKLVAENYGRYIAETSEVGVSCLRIGMVRADDDPAQHVDEPGFDWIPGGRAGVLDRFQATWLYHDDLWRIVHEELRATERYRLRYAVSDNPGRYWVSARIEGAVQVSGSAAGLPARLRRAAAR